MTDHSPADSADGIDYIAVEESERFRTLKRTQRSFIFPLAAFFLIWYFVYVLLGAFATDFMAQRVWGDITVGLLAAFLTYVQQFFRPIQLASQVYTQAQAALAAVAGRVESGAAPGALGARPPAAGAVPLRGPASTGHRTLDSAPTGMRRSASRSRSSWGARPSVVR